MDLCHFFLRLLNIKWEIYSKMLQHYHIDYDHKNWYVKIKMGWVWGFLANSRNCHPLALIASKRQDSDLSYLAPETGILEPWQQPTGWQTIAGDSGAVILVLLQFFLQVNGLLALLWHDLLPPPVDSLQGSPVSFALDGSVHSGSN